MKLSMTADDMSRINAELIINHDRLRRKIWMTVFTRCGPFNDLPEIHDASKLASNAVINFDEFFKANSNDN